MIKDTLAILIFLFFAGLLIFGATAATLQDGIIGLLGFIGYMLIGITLWLLAGWAGGHVADFLTREKE